MAGRAIRVQVFDSLAAAEAVWSTLERSAPCTPYQTRAWAEAWCETVGAAQQASPHIVTAFDAAGRPIALLPFVRSTRLGLTVARFLGGKDSNANLGLFSDPAAWDEAAVRGLLRAAAEVGPVDLYALRNQPDSWDGQSNPILILPHRPSPSNSRVGRLSADAEQTLSIRLSKHARKLLRQKESRLQSIGPVEHRRPRDAGETEAIVAAHIAQKAARAGTTGIAPPSPALAAFLRRGAQVRAIEWHALWCGPDIVATFAGAGHRDRFSGMVLAFDSRPDIARCSPGEILLKHVMADLGRRSFTGFDLGIGEARYKETFCDTVEPMFDCFIGETPGGRAAATLFSCVAQVKRRAKRSTVVGRVTRVVRRTMRPPVINRP